MQVKELATMVGQTAALRRRQQLQPVGGKGDKIFPPTYPGEGRNAPPRHVLERRRIDGNDIWCVLVDSVQSQANRMEESLSDLVSSGIVSIPHLVVDFGGKGLSGIGEITSFLAPHRVYDAIFRDSLYQGKEFMKSDDGMRLAKASPTDATALLELSPTALLFGAWHSTGQGGGLGAKFARCLVSEIVAVNVPVNVKTAERRDATFLIASGDSFRGVDVVTAGRRTGSRIDPLGVLRKVEVYKTKTNWDLTAAKAGKEAKLARPSEINHGNIAPTVQELGITCDYLDRTFVLSFAAIRRLRFGTDEARTEAGRTYLAALGILASIEQDQRGYALRSRCDLVPEKSAGLENVLADGTARTVKLSIEDARNLYNEAYDCATAAGFKIAKEPHRLEPQEKLIDIVRQSQNLALEGQGGEDETGEDSNK